MRDGGRAVFIVGPPSALERDITANAFSADVNRERLEALNRLVEVNRLLGYERRVGLSSRPEHTILPETSEQICLFFQHFLGIDQNSHMLWAKHENELLEAYRTIDEAVGWVRQRAGDATLLVMSDHGFAAFDRAVHLNAWLRDRGFLALKTASGDDTGLSSIDWSATEAYAAGLNGLYLNLKGRERDGTVERGQRSAALLENLREQLVAFRDAANGRQVIEAVYRTNPAAQNATLSARSDRGLRPGLPVVADRPGRNAGFGARGQ